MSTKKFSLLTAGIIWILVGLRIGTRAVTWLQPYFEEPDWKLGLLVVSILIAVVKARTVLRKAVNRNVGNLDKINDKFVDYFTGWIKLFGVKGIVLISLMMALGYGLRALRDIGSDPYNLFGFLYFGVALALIGGSLHYFNHLRRL